MLARREIRFTFTGVLRSTLLILAGVPISLSLTRISDAQPVVLTEVRRLSASDGWLGDDFGSTVAIDGGVVVAGAPDARHNGTNTGAAYVFDTATGTELRKLTALDGQSGDKFGTSVSVHNGITILGAIFDADNGVGSGSAYTFNVNTGEQLRKLLPSDGGISDNFGGDVDIHGHLAIVGAQFDGPPSQSASGSAYVFDVVTGSQIVKLTASDAGMFHQFGWSVAIYQETAIVGAPKDIGTNQAGKAYVYDATTGSQRFILSGNSGNERIGTSVAADRERIIVGAYGSESAYVFDRSTGTQLYRLRASDGTNGDRFGSSVAIDGDLAVVGSRYEGTSAEQFGAAYVFDLSTGTELFKLTASDRLKYGEFGYSVAIEGETAVVGATNTGGFGTVYTYVVPEPSPIGALIIFGSVVVVYSHGSRRLLKPLRLFEASF